MSYFFQKHFLWWILAGWLLSPCVSAQPLSVEELQKLGLPVLEVETVHHEEPTCEVVYPPEGAVGIGITNATKVPGRVRLFGPEGLLYDSGEYAEDLSGMTLKIRGNTNGSNNKKCP